jgi:hypothetical protein
LNASINPTSCSGCGSYILEKLVLVFRNDKFGGFQEEEIDSCPCRSECLNVGSTSCWVCHWKVTMIRYHFSEATMEILKSCTSADNWCRFAGGREGRRNGWR